MKPEQERRRTEVLVAASEQMKMDVQGTLKRLSNKAGYQVKTVLVQKATPEEGREALCLGQNSGRQFNRLCRHFSQQSG